MPNAIILAERLCFLERDSVSMSSAHLILECAACGQRVRVGESMAGQEVDCPTCDAVISACDRDEGSFSPDERGQIGGDSNGETAAAPQSGGSCQDHPVVPQNGESVDGSTNNAQRRRKLPTGSVDSRVLLQTPARPVEGNSDSRREFNPLGLPAVGTLCAVVGIGFRCVLTFLAVMTEVQSDQKRDAAVR